jgi:hypothetical protein
VVIGDVGLLRRESERLRLGLAITPVASPGALGDTAMSATLADPLAAFSNGHRFR